MFCLNWTLEMMFRRRIGSKRLTVYLLLALIFFSVVLSDDAQAVEQKNVLLICVDDLRPELASFGVSYIHSPNICLLYTSPSPRDGLLSRMPSSA